MYGKIFSSMYEGSLVGAGPAVFAVLGYCISKADSEDSTVMLNPILLAQIIGTSDEEIKKAVNFLCLPDPDSKNPDHDGRRLLHVSGFSYFLVSHQHYRNMKNMSDVRDYERERKKKQRENKNVPECPGQSGTPASASVSVSASVSGIKEGDARGSSPLDEAMVLFSEHRKKLKKPCTDHALGLLKEKALKLGGNEEEAVRHVNHAIEHGWQGIFAIKEDFIKTGGKGGADHRTKKQDREFPEDLDF